MSDLTPEEQRNVRFALKCVKAKFRQWKLLAKALNFEVCTLSHAVNGQRPVSVLLAFRTARLMKVPVDDILEGRYPLPGTCPHCGHCPQVNDESNREGRS